jgi:hypothetical protein
MVEPGPGTNPPPAEPPPIDLTEPAPRVTAAHTHAQAPRLRRAVRWLLEAGRDAGRSMAGYFAEQDPTFWAAVTPALILAALLFVRSPASNYIFDEQEALLANPYVNAQQGLTYWDAFRRDFWGLPNTRTIGSYRPVPNLIWRALWQISKLPWLHHWVNVVIHSLNGALIAGFAFAVTRRRATSWLVGASFLASAVLTETVSGVVGIADVFGGLGVLLGLAALRLPLWAMPWAVFLATALGLFSKESCLVALPLVTWAALVTAPVLHPRRPWRGLRALLALLGTVGALVGYTYVRRHLFPVGLSPEFERPLGPETPWPARAIHEFMRWFQQPKLPSDAINNPLINAPSYALRVAGSLRVYWRGLVQVVFPWTLSGDYSFSQEPVPERVLSVESVLGGFFLVVPPLVGLFAWVKTLWLRAGAFWRRVQQQGGLTAGPADTRAQERIAHSVLLALGLVWIPVAYFPHSNIPTLLPTVRAERFWYLPVIGSSFLLAALASALYARLPGRRLVLYGFSGFFAFQAMMARWHAFDYTDDLRFWDATRHSSPRSAKAHLNYSVMVGARGRLEERLAANGRAKELAPEWPMAYIYYGDTLCRMDKPNEAWPHYLKGFELAPNDSNLIALGLQCLWDHQAIKPREEALLELAEREKYRGSWLAYLAREIVTSGDKHGGVEKKYRPRGYDEGPQNE